MSTTKHIEEALSTNCDLWVVPPPQQSHWFAHIDWYLNWQLCRGLVHQPQPPSGPIYQIAQEHNVDVPKIKSRAEAPLLVLSEGRVPATKCVMVPKAASFGAWVKQVAMLVESLQSKCTYVFLPAKATDEDWNKHWERNNKSEVFLVVDGESP